MQKICWKIAAKTLPRNPGFTYLHVAKDFGTKKLKRGELTLLSTIWQIQHKNNLESGAHREEILEVTGWSKAQFDGYLNDLRSRSKEQYVIGRGPYYLADKHLVTKTETAKILSSLRPFANTNRNICPQGQIPLDPFVSAIKKKQRLSAERVREIIERARVKKYLVKVPREENRLYIEPGVRIRVEHDWIAYLVEQNGR